jgi:pyrophosphate--fructose-6-phosphate 1-phosphotransferase
MPYALQGGPVMVMRGEATAASDPSDALVISRSFPLTYGQPLVHLKSAAGTGGILNVSSPGHAMRVAVVFSGRQSPGGHNVVAGLFDALKAQNSANVLLGFVGK